MDEKEVREILNRRSAHIVATAKKNMHEFADEEVERAEKWLKERLENIKSAADFTVPLDILKIISAGGDVKSKIITFENQEYQRQLELRSDDYNHASIFKLSVPNAGPYRITVIVESIADLQAVIDKVTKASEG